MAINEEKLQLYIVAIVGVVAAVGILVLLVGTNLSIDLSGQAVAVQDSDDEKELLKKQLKDAEALKKKLSTVNTASGSDCKVPSGYVCCGTCRDGGVCSVLASASTGC